MIWQFNPYAIPLFISAVPLTVVIYFGWRHRANLAARMFLGFIGGALGLVLAYALELLSADLQSMLFWLRWEYLSHWAMVFWLLFAIVYGGYEHWLTRRRVLALFVVPVIILVLVWTNQAHGLIWSTTSAEMVGSVALFDRSYGAAFWVWMVYLAIMLIAGDIILIRRAIYSPGYFRGQLGWLLAAFLLPFTGISLTVARITPIPLLDLSPYGVALACIPVAISLFRFHLFDLIPAAYELIIESMSDVVLVCDAQSRVVQVNSAAAQLIGRTAAQIVGNSVEQVFRKLSDPVDSHLLDGSSAHQEVTIESGSGTRYFDLRISPLRNHQAQITGKVYVLRDITDRRRAAQQSFELAVERERVHVLELFIQDASHDFRTPISIILTSAYLMDKFSDAAAKQLSLIKQRETEGGSPLLPSRELTAIASSVTKIQEKTRVVRASGERLEKLVESILEVLELERAPKLLQKSADMNRMIEELVRDHAGSAGQKHQQIAFEPDAALPDISIDKWKLGRAVQKLLDNAVEFTPEFGVITVRTFRQVDDVVIEVCDTGIGISPEDLPHVFDAFYRVDRARSIASGGVGMGLSIARRIVEAHGGQIEVASTPEQGSDFRIRVPMHSETNEG